MIRPYHTALMALKEIGRYDLADNIINYGDEPHFQPDSITPTDAALCVQAINVAYGVGSDHVSQCNGCIVEAFRCGVINKQQLLNANVDAYAYVFGSDSIKKEKV